MEQEESLMGLTIAQKIIKNHLVSGEMTVGSDIGLRIDQTLTQDATGTMAYLEFDLICRVVRGFPRASSTESMASCTTCPVRAAVRADRRYTS